MRLGRSSSASLLLLAGSLAPGCGDDTASSGAPPSRVVAVAPNQSQRTSLADFCDNTARNAFRWPELDGPTPAPVRRWRWVNVWATWCRPCVEEMPRLAAFRQELRGDDIDVDLVFLSVDESSEVVARFRSEHATIPESVRIADPSTLAAWVPSLGLDAGATLPIHAFVDGTGSTRCVRTGAVGESDFDTVRSLLSH